MPFDGTGFQPEPRGRGPSAPSDNMITMIIVAFALALLVMPISVAGLVDLVKYIRSS